MLYMSNFGCWGDSGGEIMKSKRILSLLLAGVLAVSTLAGCGNGSAPDGQKQEETGAVQEETDQTTEQAEPSQGKTEESAHEPITMNALVPFRNPSELADLVHEKYPEINIEFIPYSGYNATAYTKMILVADDMPDIYFGSMYTPGLLDANDRLIDLSAYSFTDNFTDQRLREVNDNGSIYLLPLYYSCIGITYNKTLLEKNGWELPNSLEELEALAPKVEEAGYQLALDQIQFPGYGFQYLFNILSTGYVNTIEGRKWQNSFLAGETTFEANEDLMNDLEILDRWRAVGMLNFDGDPDSDTNTRARMAEGNTLFMVGNVANFTKEDSSDEFGFMPFLSAGGMDNTYIANVTKYVGLNKHLQDEGNEQKLEDALHVMEVMCTVDGMLSLSANHNGDVLVPLKDYVIPDDSYYKPIEKALNEGYVAPYIYTGWEDLVVPVGEKMFSFMKGECEITDVIKEMDADQYLLKDNSDNIYTTVTEKLEVEDCVKLVGTCFAKAVNADAALVSTNKWFQTDEDIAMNTKGVQCPLYAMPITDEELTAMLPTGWTGTIQTVTLTGARIQELFDTGYDKYGDGERLFPYHLVAPDGFELEEDTIYSVVICGVSEAVQEEGNIQDTGIVGLTVAEDYLSQFETLTPADLVWE